VTDLSEATDHADRNLRSRGRVHGNRACCRSCATTRPGSVVKRARDDGGGNVAIVRAHAPTASPERSTQQSFSLTRPRCSRAGCGHMIIACGRQALNIIDSRCAAQRKSGESCFSLARYGATFCSSPQGGRLRCRAGQYLSRHALKTYAQAVRRGGARSIGWKASHRCMARLSMAAGQRRHDRLTRLHMQRWHGGHRRRWRRHRGLPWRRSFCPGSIGESSAHDL